MTLKIQKHTFHKAFKKALNHQLVKFKIKITLLNREAKIKQKSKHNMT